ncbi:hypothetical protein H0H87_010129 [Tephrocybe sp. NHM501043]|nr:hypothetical protein H0H87_010129 [Tephrocybe sp. NHM501043]
MTLSRAPFSVRGLLKVSVLFEEIRDWSTLFGSSYSIDCPRFSVVLHEWIHYLKDKLCNGAGYGRDFSKDTWELIRKIQDIVNEIYTYLAELRVRNTAQL